MARFRIPLDSELVRIRIVLAGMIAAFLLLAAGLWRVQVAKGERYQEDLVRQSVRRVRLPGIRGRILDRQGRVLADNRPSYCIALYLEELRRPGGWSRTIDRVELLTDRLAQVLEIPRAVAREEIATHIRKRLPLPLLAWRDVNSDVLARFAERASGVPGVDIHVEALRTYPYGELACHVLGYVGRAEFVQDEDVPYHYYLPEMAGHSGVERKMDGVLRGEAGGRLLRVDVSGFRHEDLAQRDPKSGSDVVLSLDLRVQRAAEDALGGNPGSVVVIDPNTGDVLAMVNRPAFDPNRFVPAISQAEWDALVRDESNPLLNRAVAGAYPPGSTFKPVVALAALENNLATPNTAFDCPGYFDLGNARFRCWTRGRHGLLTMHDAIQYSCNVYFYRLGMQCGHDAIYHMAAALGFGKETGITLSHEVAGLLPSDGWMRRVYGHGWRAGDTCNFSIGQGSLLVTPLQLALAISAIANGGHLYQPRLVTAVKDPASGDVREIPPQLAHELHWSETSIRTVREGMRDVVMAPRGTGRLAYLEGLTYAGKTGTAEYGKKEEGKKRGWMVAFAPYDQPRYAVAMLMEEAMTGGVTVAPRMRDLMAKLFNLEPAKVQG